MTLKMNINLLCCDWMAEINLPTKSSGGSSCDLNWTDLFSSEWLQT